MTGGRAESAAEQVAEVVALFADAVEQMRTDPGNATLLQRTVVQGMLDVHARRQRMPAGFAQMPETRRRALMIADAIAEQQTNRQVPIDYN
jgi:hypothetical protein